MSILTIKDCMATIADKAILKGVDLTINPGEVHVIMGPNGAGKSTLANVLAGRPGFDVDGVVDFDGKDLLALSPEEKAQHGLFLAFQYPVEIPGVNTLQFIKTCYNSIQKFKGEEECDAYDFMALVKSKLALVDMDDKYLRRALNEGFSGGEKKRNEILQMLVLNPRLAILDEIDSGLDVDALQSVAKGINAYKNNDNAVLMVTHYQRLLNYITPDFVHVMVEGKIVASGDAALARAIEETGYNDYIKAEA